MSILQKDHLDLLQGGDTGQDNVDAIQPVEDGEGATQTVFRRPSENLRGRTEVLRDALKDLLYYRDASHIVIEGGTGHSVGWAGSTTAASTGIITQTGDLILRPLLTPAASTKGSLSLGTTAVNGVIYTVAAAAYATQGLNAVTVEHRDAGAGATHQCTITDGPVKRILVEFDAADVTHTSTATKVLVDAAVAADIDLATLIVVTDDGAAGSAIAASTETYIEGTADQEAHRLVSGALTTFTTANPLAEGDAVGIWYRYVIEPGGASGDASDPKGGVFGGRQESNPDRGTHTIPQASLFVTSSDPEKIPGAVPICKVVNNELVFVDGSRFVAGMTGALGTAAGLSVDSSAFQGTRTLTINGGLPTSPDPNTAQALFEATDVRLGQLRVATYTCTDGVTSTGGDFTGVSAVSDAVTAAGGTGAVIYVRRGTYTIPNSFAMGANVAIVGEDKAAVILSQAAPVSWSLSSNSHLQSVTIDTGFFIALGASVSGSISNVCFTSGGVEVGGDYWNLKDVEFQSTEALGAVLSVTGDHATLHNIKTEASVVVTGTHNHITNVHIVPNANFSRTLFTLSGTDNVIMGLRIDPLTAAPFDADDPIVSVTGDRNRITTGVISQVGAPLTVTNSVLELLGGEHNVFSGLKLETTDGHALSINNTSGVNTKTVFENCNFSNDLTAGSLGDYLVGISGVNYDDHHVTWRNCTFDQNEKGAAVMFALNSGPTSLQRWFFYNCNLLASVTDNLTVSTFTDSTFYSCIFTIKNPEIGGVRILPGSVGAPLWIFEQSTAGLGCSLDNCVFDFLDSEVELDPTDPYTGAIFGYFARLQGSIAKNLKIINVNTHIHTGTAATAGSLIHLGHVSTVDGFEIVFTNTVSASGGTANIGYLVSMEDNSQLRDWRHLEHPHAQRYIRITGDTTIKIADCRLYGACEEIVRKDSGTVDYLTVENCKFGDATTAQALPINIPAGTGTIFKDTYWYQNSALNMFFASTDASITDLLITNCTFWNTADLASAFSVFSVTGATMTLRIGNTSFITEDSSAGTRELFSPGGAVGAVAVGVYFINAGGATDSLNVVPVVNLGW